mgnify:FL=1
MQNKFKVLDDSGDRRYFTIIPNYIVNHSTPYEQAIYLYMKRVAGETGTCWTSNQEIGKKLQCSRNTISKYRNKLIKRGWIEIVGSKKVGTTKQTVPEYKIIDLWELNNNFYTNKNKEVSNNDTLQEVSSSDEKVSTVDGKVSPVGHKEEPIKKNQEEDTEQSSGNVNLLIKEFENINPACKTYYARPPQRNACKGLISDYGFERVRSVIEKTLPRTNELQFFPTITTPIQLQEKWATLESAIKRYQSENKKIKSSVAF